ncbi:hypothetical protein QQ045_014617 [Rhodiola kirilowii]
MGSMDAIRMEAWDFFGRSSQEVKDLTFQLFKSMDTNDDNCVDCFQEIEIFFQDGNFLIQPYHWIGLIMALDRDHDGALDFDEFITFFYIVFVRAKCDQCDKWLMGKKRRTCIDCFSHHHPRSQLLNYEEVIFNGNVPGPRDVTTSYRTVEPRQELFRRLFIALQALAAAATIVTAAVTCSIM